MATFGVGDRATQKKAEKVNPLETALSDSYWRREWLSYTAKGLFPDIEPSNEKIKQSVEEIAERELCYPLKPKNPLFREVRELDLPGLITHPRTVDEFRDALTKEEWENRKRALFYAFLSARGKPLSQVEYLSVLGQALEEEYKKAVEEGKPEHVIQNVSETAEAVKEVLLYREELLKELRKAFEKFNAPLREMVNPAFRELLESRELSPEERKEIDEKFSLLFGELGKVEQRELMTPVLDPSTVKIAQKVLSPQGQRYFTLLWENYGKPLSEVVEKPTLLEVKRALLQSALFLEIVESLKDKHPSFYSKVLENPFYYDLLGEKINGITIEDAIKKGGEKLKTLIEDYKKRRKEDLRDGVLDFSNWPENLKNFIYFQRDFEERMEELWRNARNLKDPYTRELLEKSIALYNLDALVEKVAKGKVPEKTLTNLGEEELSLKLGVKALYYTEKGALFKVGGAFEGLTPLEKKAVNRYLLNRQREISSLLST